jgi:hypothetical protein
MKRKSNKTMKLPEVSLIGQPKRLVEKALGPYENGGLFRMDEWFDLELQVNGKVLPSVLHLWRMEGKGGKSVDNFEPGWSASLNMNCTDWAKVQGVGECLKCNGNRGRSGPLTAGDTNRAVGPVIQATMGELGYEITTKYHDYVKRPDLYVSCLALFYMHVDAWRWLSDITKGRLIGVRTQIDCPVHGVIVQDELEVDCD